MRKDDESAHAGSSKNRQDRHAKLLSPADRKPIWVGDGCCAQMRVGSVTLTGFSTQRVDGGVFRRHQSSDTGDSVSQFIVDIYVAHIQDRDDVVVSLHHEEPMHVSACM